MKIWHTFTQQRKVIEAKSAALEVWIAGSPHISTAGMSEYWFTDITTRKKRKTILEYTKQAEATAKRVMNLLLHSTKNKNNK